MAQNNIDDVLDHLRMIKSGGYLNIVDIEALEMELRFFRTFLKNHHVLWPDSLVKITKKAKLIVEMLAFGGIPEECRTNIYGERLVSQLWEFIEGSASSMLNYESDDSYLIEYMDYLEKNLNDAPYLVKSDPFLIKETKILQKTDRYLRQLIFIQKKMRFLRYLYSTEINGYVNHEKLKGLLTRIQFMAENVGHFCPALWVNEDEDDADSKKDENDTDSDEDDTDSKEDGDDTFNIESKLPYLLFLIVLVELEMKKIFLCELKASKFTQSRTFKDKKLPKGFSHHLHGLLMYLRQKKLKNFVSARNIDVAIEFLLVFLGDVPNHVINGKRLNEVLEKIGVLVGDVLCVIQMHLEGSIIKEDASKIDLSTIQIFEKIEDLKAQVEEKYKYLEYNPSHEFPTVGGLSFLYSLLCKLNEMLKSETGLVFMMKPHIGILEKELSSLMSVFGDVAQVQREHKILKELRKHIINLAYEAEVSIDSTLAQYNVLWHSFHSLPAIIEEIKHTRMEVTKMWSENLVSRPYSVVEPSKHLPTQYNNLMNDEEIVGFENDTRIIQHLIQGRNELDVIPIVGMGGQGKTTCARKLYNSDIIVSHFDVRAWCIITQTYNWRELLQEIFSQVTGSKDEGDKDDILADMLRKSLMGKRYLIVLDDMWDGMAWDDLRLSFPDVGNRSRIVVTTRLVEVGVHVIHHTDLYFFPFLTPEEACRLLQKKVFQKEVCPSELEDVSLAVAKRCKGLTLVVVLVAGIIKKRKMEESWWNEIENTLFSYLSKSEEYSLETMLLSYYNLPDHLRPCLLYMGMFLEDERIPVSQLISLWIAEGFVQNIQSGSLEDAAEGYLMDLISSNVVMVSRRRYNGKVKYCQVHDVVLHFCLEMSSEEKFMLALKGNRSQFQPCDWKESRVSFSFNNELSMFASLGSKTRKRFQEHLRSLITTNLSEFHDWNPFRQVSEVRLLKVLDLSSHTVDHFGSATLKPLIHLKYLSVHTITFNFHREPHLPHLEALIVKCFIKPTVLPKIFWKMEKLRHVDISKAVIDLEGIFEESPKLENLRILRNARFRIRNADSVDVLLWGCPNLQEFEIFFKGDNKRYFSPNLESLTQLQILRLYVKWPRIVSELHLPSNLMKMVLTGNPTEVMISLIAGLPSLEYLKLSRKSQIWMKLGEWCLRDIAFHKLKFLKLVWLNISRLDVSEESFPQLETLVIKGNDELKEVPLSFADVPTLKQIKLIDCNESLEASAVRIKEEVQAIEGCDRLQLIIIKVSRNKLLCVVFEYQRASNVQTICSIQERWQNIRK
ncbi:putative late blight resistance protein homolog R1A-3 [Solanum verrucosum]|uniref:putative late blight resistance protein homolog R1A-3 n=1 Tax=Solanum verrucosum TaxID=315347 RepID=UPI0020D152DC|nr:putative late blight resistance protein homolog R1A-3 [Solanum verrucosum]